MRRDQNAGLAHGLNSCPCAPKVSFKLSPKNQKLSDGISNLAPSLLKQEAEAMEQAETVLLLDETRMRLNISTSEIGGFVTSFIRRNKANQATTRPKLHSPLKHPHGPFHFQFALTPGCPFEVQSSLDLINWITVSSGVFSGEMMDYVDSSASDFSARFYRVRSGELSSENILGFAAVSIPPGFSMIANPFDSVSNTVSSLMAKMPDGTTLSKFDPSQHKLSSNTYRNDRWKNPHEKLSPGEGGILFNPSNDYLTLNFSGKVQQGNLFNPIPAGFSIRSSLVPRPGRLNLDLQFPLSEGDTIQIFDRDRQEYVTYKYPSPVWEKNPPVIGICEAFWVQKTSPENWSRTLWIE